MKALFFVVFVALTNFSYAVEKDVVPVLRLERIPIGGARILYDKVICDFAFHLNEKKYESIDALKIGLLAMEKGTIITFRPGCVRFGGEPLDSMQSYRELGQYCEALGLEFRVLRAGGTFIYPEEK